VKSRDRTDLDSRRDFSRFRSRFFEILDRNLDRQNWSRFFEIRDFSRFEIFRDSRSISRSTKFRDSRSRFSEISIEILIFGPIFLTKLIKIFKNSPDGAYRRRGRTPFIPYWSRSQSRLSRSRSIPIPVFFQKSWSRFTLV
jgi:hypothetical protein